MRWPSDSDSQMTLLRHQLAKFGFPSQVRSGFLVTIIGVLVAVNIVQVNIANAQARRPLSTIVLTITHVVPVILLTIIAVADSAWYRLVCSVAGYGSSMLS